MDSDELSFGVSEFMLFESLSWSLGYGVVTMCSRNEVDFLSFLITRSEGRIVTLRLRPLPGTGKGDDMARSVTWVTFSGFASVLAVVMIVGWIE